MNTRAAIASLSTSLAILLATTGPSLAAEPAQGAKSSKPDTIPEIIVSARKREESLQEVPIAISAFTPQDIEDKGMVRVEDIARFTPSFSFHSGFGRNLEFERPSMRGITTINNGIAGSKSISTFIDGIYVGGMVSSVELSNLERVEVLKGPQSAEYGRGTYAGAINYITRRPSDELEGQVEATAAQHDTYAGTAWVSGPILSGKLNFFVGAGHDEYGGEYKNTVDGSTVGSEETDSIVGKLFYMPTENLDITLKLGYQKVDDGHFAVALLKRTENNGYFRTTEAPRAREYYVGTVPEFHEVNLWTNWLDAAGGGGAGNRQDRFSSSLKLVWDFAGGYTLTSNSGYIDDSADSYFDASYGGYDTYRYVAANAPAFVPNLRRDLCLALACGTILRIAEFDQSDKSTELRLSSPVDRNVRWSAGLYYYKGTKDETRDDHISTPNPYGVPAGEIISNDDLVNEEVKNTAVFGSIEWDLSDQWTATTELRWAEDDIRSTSVTDLGAVKPGKDFSTTNDALTPRLILAYQQNDDFNYYASIAKGTRPGAFNPKVPNIPGTALPDESFRYVDEETVWSYELGMKSRLLDGRATLNLAGYYSDVSNQQFNAVFQLSDGNITSALQNAGKTRIYGLEAEFSMLLTEDLTMSATYSYTDSEFEEWISSDEADLRGSNGTYADIQEFGSVKGNKAPRIPENMASLFLRYERPLVNDWRWFASGDVTYEGSRYAAEHNLAKTGDQKLVGLRLGISGSNWDFEVFGKNIFDDLTPVDVLRFVDTESGTLPVLVPMDPVSGAPNSVGASVQPRGFGIVLPRGSQWGLTARYRF